MSTRRPWTPPTLRDIARECGVSPATASRALADGGAHLPRATSLVRSRARELGYVRQPRHAGGLVAFTSDVGRTGYWETLSGINDVARDRDLETTIVVISGSRDNRRRTLDSALQRRIDGAVLLEFDSPSVEILDQVPRDLPIAIAGGYPGADPTVPRAWINDFDGAVRATTHLVELGHRRIGFVGLPAAGHPDPRVQGWRHVLTRESLPVVAQLGTGWSAETGRRAAGNALAAGVTAVVCGNDDLAFGVIAGLGGAGIRIPDQMSVIGMDDHPLAASATPSLSTVRLDFHEMGAVAARICLGEPVEPMVDNCVQVPTRVIVRDSTGAHREPV